MTARVSQIFNPQNGVTENVWREGDVIHKVIRARAASPEQWPPSSDPRNWNYWQREAVAYREGLPLRLGLAGPRLLALEVDPRGERIELQLAALEGRTQAELTVDDLVELAERLGRSQGAAHTDEPWLSRGFLEGYTANRVVDWSLLTSDAAWQQELIAPWFTEEIRAGVVRLRQSSPRLHQIASRLPRTVGHLDVFPANIFVDAEGPKLIDWAFVGDAALGEDIGNLIPDSIFDMFQPLAAIDELCERLPAAYLAGLRAAGWSGDPRLVELGIMATGSVKYDWLAPRVLERAAAAQQTTYGGVVIPDPRPNYAARAAGLALCARWSDRALVLAEELGL